MLWSSKVPKFPWKQPLRWWSTCRQFTDECNITWNTTVREWQKQSDIAISKIVIQWRQWWCERGSHRAVISVLISSIAQALTNSNTEMWCKLRWTWKSRRPVRLFATPWTIHSMEFSRPEYWSTWPFPTPGDLPNAGIESRSPVLQGILY